MKKYQEASVEKIDKKIYKKIKEKVVQGKKGVFLFGNTGTGKTYILHAIKNRVKEISPRTSVVFENWVDLLIDLRDDFNKLRSTIDNISENEMIMIDDLGSEKMTEWSQEILYSIVNKAYEREKKIFIATNLSLEQFTERYGDRIFSRLAEACEMIEMKGEDRRLD